MGKQINKLSKFLLGVFTEQGKIQNLEEEHVRLVDEIDYIKEACEMYLLQESGAKIVVELETKLRELELKLAQHNGNPKVIRDAQENLGTALHGEIAINKKEINDVEEQLCDANLGPAKSRYYRSLIENNQGRINEINDRIGLLDRTKIPTAEEADKELAELQILIEKIELDLYNYVYTGVEREKVVGELRALQYRQAELMKLKELYWNSVEPEIEIVQSK